MLIAFIGTLFLSPIGTAAAAQNSSSAGATGLVTSTDTERILLAQWRVPRDTSALDQINRLWAGYRPGSGVKGREVLEQIMSLGSLPPTVENAGAVLSLLNSEITLDEKVALVRILGTLYLRLSDSRAKADIETYLSSTASATNDPVLGKAATLMYSRIGYFPDSLAVLARAHSAGFISDNDYFGDIAHLVPLAPAGEQARLFRQLAGADNNYSRLVLAEVLNDRALVQALPRDVAAQAAAVLAKSEPKFPPEINRLGAFDAIQYERWLAATVMLNAQVSGDPEHSVMARVLIIDGADPRKLIAVLLSDTTSQLVRSAFDRRSLEKMDVAIADFASRNARNSAIQEFADAARRHLSVSGK